MTPTEHELWQDERAAARRERDRQLEPQRLFPVLREGPLKNNSLTTRLKCPCCQGAIYVAADSEGETLTCPTDSCHVELETYQLNGKVALEIATLDMEPDGDAL